MSNRGDGTLDRRTLLQITGASTVAGALSALAGCAGQSDGDGTETTESSGGGGGGGSDTEDTSGGGGGSLQRLPELNFVTWTQSNKPGYFEQTQMMASEFEKLGIPTSINPQQFPQPYLNTLQVTWEYDLLMLGMEGAAYRLEPSFYLNTVLHSQYTGENQWNSTGFENEEFDQLSEEQQTILDQEERQSVVYELQRIQQEQQAWTVYQSPHLASGLNTSNFSEPSDTVPGEGYGSVWSLVSFESNGGDALDYGKVLSNIKSFNPLAAQSADDIQFLEPIYDSLTRIGPSGNAENWVAEDITVEDDTTLTVTLMDGLTFHDGEDVTGEDVAFSYRFQKENEAPYVASYLEPLEEATADGQQVTFSLSEPYAPFNMLTMGQVPILPKHIWETVTEDNDVSNPANYQNKPPVGSGPFEFSRHQDGTFLELTGVDDHPHAPNIDTFRFRLYGNKSSAQQALLNGQIDVIDQLPSTLRGNVQSAGNLKLNYQPQHGLRTLLANERNGRPFTDAAFRRALSYAVPRKRIRNQVYDGRAELGGSIIAPANEFWHNPDVTPNEYNLDQARSILEDAGYDWDDDGRLLYPTE